MDLFLYEFEANTPVPISGSSLPTLDVRTCQRTFLLAWQELPLQNARRTFRGSDAYEFLLRFAAGLESEIKGETDVFGQLKASVRVFQETHPDAHPDCHALFSRIFEDTKEIRAQYLQGIGGHTYGALARRILNPSPDSRVLILGAGQISKSVAPYFADSKLCIFNRTPERLDELKSDLSQKGYSQIVYTCDASSLPEQILGSDILLMAVPPGSPLDALVIQSLVTHALTTGPLASSRPSVLHLGGQSRDLADFEAAGIPILSLSDLFAIEKEQSVFRDQQIQQAEEACHRRALLRSMARSISIPHGWEDLAVFY
jgi:glutamyl-tRNA reductase